MIRKLVEKDRQEVMTFLSEESSINLFTIGDIEAFGFDNEKQDVYGDYDDGLLKGVLLRYNENFIPYYKTEEFEIEGFAEIIRNFDKEKMISGKECIAIKFKNLIKDVKLKPTYSCEITSKEKLIECQLELKKATVKDGQRVFDFLAKIEEFGSFGMSPERVVNKIENNTGRIYLVEDALGEILTISQTTAENSQSAMVVGVATRKDARGQGLMSQCLSQLCSDLLDEGKKLCLFYDNPKAGAVYHKLGFKSIDNWMMMTK